MRKSAKLADLNIRDIPDEFKMLLKIDAANKGISLKELCLKRLAVSPDQIAVIENHTEGGK